MFRQLNHLTIAADGRYARPEELNFLRDYLASVETRISAYEKIRAEAEMMADKIQSMQKAENPRCFHFVNGDRSEICRRDLVDTIRLCAVAMLFSELDLLRDNFLLWYRTIVKSFNYEQSASSTYGKYLPNLMKQLLTPQEQQVMEPVLALSSSILAE
ncbi:MAG: allophycocyanin subunit beta [Thermosynechococcus sp.]|uniref:allophycocyanin n=1 Tax=Thermosynechococcus sp. TaxID=2814275 RepID=UPI0021FE872C|nr:allophycocyanin [Thermosynechococcus sp.]BCX12938.1 MAG: allophycocyanin subunit beta [Thermosynechococcus sp.]